MEFKWVCLYNDCRHVNLDDFLKTATPACEICGQKYWWDQLLTKKQMAAGNALLEVVLDELDGGLDYDDNLQE